MVVEVKYFSTQNVVIHTKNCKLELPLDCSITQMEKNIVDTFTLYEYAIMFSTSVEEAVKRVSN